MRLRLVAALAAFALLSYTSRLLQYSFALSMADALVEDRTVRVLQFPRMPSDTSVAIKVIRNLQSTNWLEEMEIEVQNNSPKPIYFLEILLSFPDLPAQQVEGQSRKQLIPLTYGKLTLMHSGRFGTKDDVSIEPGKTHVFRIAEAQWMGFKSVLTEMALLPSSIRNIDLLIERVSFGDGTGYYMGSPFNRASQGPSQTDD